MVKCLENVWTLKYKHKDNGCQLIFLLTQTYSVLNVSGCVKNQFTYNKNARISIKETRKYSHKKSTLYVSDIRHVHRVRVNILHATSDRFY